MDPLTDLSEQAALASIDTDDSVQSRAVAVYAIHSRILSFLPRRSLQAAARVSTSWFAVAAKYLFAELSIGVHHKTQKLEYAWPIMAARASSTSQLSATTVKTLQWARSTALDSIRVLSIEGHSHAACDSFILPASLATPGLERPIVALQIPWRGWSSLFLTCPLAECFNPQKIVLHRLSALSTYDDNRIPCISQTNSRVRKLVLALDPPTGPPGPYRVYEDLPSAITHVVVQLREPDVVQTGLWTGGAWGQKLAVTMRKGGWGADKLAGHFGNMLLYFSGSGRRITFVGCERLDVDWLLEAAQGIDLGTGDTEEVGVQVGPGEIFERLVLRAATTKMRKLVENGKVDDQGVELGLGLDVQFVTHEAYLAQDDIEGEIFD